MDRPSKKNKLKKLPHTTASEVVVDLNYGHISTHELERSSSINKE